MLSIWKSKQKNREIHKTKETNKNVFKEYNRRKRTGIKKKQLRNFKKETNNCDKHKSITTHNRNAKPNLRHRNYNLNSKRFTLGKNKWNCKSYKEENQRPNNHEQIRLINKNNIQE